MNPNFSATCLPVQVELPIQEAVYVCVCVICTSAVLKDMTIVKPLTSEPTMGALGFQQSNSFL